MALRLDFTIVLLLVPSVLCHHVKAAGAYKPARPTSETTTTEEPAKVTPTPGKPASDDGSPDPGLGEIRFKSAPHPGNPDPRRPGPSPPDAPSAVCVTRYLYHPEKSDWEGAKSICEIEGGQLAVVTSEREQGRIGSRFGRLREFWIGGTDIEREGQFRWVNGQSLGFARWYRSQPSKKYPNNEHCVTFNYWGKDAQWGDRNCYDSRPFLCETVVCKPAPRGRFPTGYPGAFKGPLRRPYMFPRNRNNPGPRGLDGYATRQWPRGRGFSYNLWERIRTPIST